jgi:ATP diphosphatase
MTQIDRLLGIMKCATRKTAASWDKEQTPPSPHTREETYEVLDAISREDFDDLLAAMPAFPGRFYAQMAQEEDV